jgi:anti-sigma factor RsiW
MNPILPEELSGLIDGALEPARAAEIHAALEHDAALKQEYERMLAVHHDMTAYAVRLTHRLQIPAVNRPVAALPMFDLRGIALAALAMLLVRLFCKLAPPLASVAVESLTLAMVIGAACVWLLRVSDRDAAQGLP